MNRNSAMRVRMKMSFGIAISATYNEAVKLDIINDNTYCQDANMKCMKNVKVDFKYLDIKARYLSGLRLSYAIESLM